MKTLKNLGYIVLVMFIVKVALGAIGVADKVAHESAPYSAAATPAITIDNIDDVMIQRDGLPAVSVKSYCTRLVAISNIIVNRRDRGETQEATDALVDGFPDTSAAQRDGYHSVVAEIYSHPEITSGNVDQATYQTRHETALTYFHR